MFLYFRVIKGKSPVTLFTALRVQLLWLLMHNSATHWVRDKEEKKSSIQTCLYAEILLHSIKHVQLTPAMLFDSLVFAGSLRLRIVKGMCLNSAINKQPQVFCCLKQKEISELVKLVTQKSILCSSFMFALRLCFVTFFTQLEIDQHCKIMGMITEQ